MTFSVCLFVYLFQIIRDENNPEIPDGYVPLMPGHGVFVPSKWLTHVQESFHNKSKTWCLKNLMSGIFEPKEVLNKTAVTLLETPVGSALKGTFEPHREKTGFLHMRKQRRRSASRLPQS